MRRCLVAIAKGNADGVRRAKLLCSASFSAVVRVFPITGRSRKIIEGLVTQHTRPGSLYYTDNWHAYASLSVRGNHVVVRKSEAVPKVGIVSMALKASGVMPSIGSTYIAECRKSFSTFTWENFRFASIIGTKTCSLVIEVVTTNPTERNQLVIGTVLGSITLICMELILIIKCS